MKKLAATLTMAAVLFSGGAAETQAASDNPTCILMKFTDDTRYDAIESAAQLSDLVMEKMVASGKFNLKETRPIDENMEKQLYDEKVREMAGFEAAMKSGDFSILFEGPGFAEDKAQSIATADVGQIVTPSVTGQIGKAHNAEYLVQGTIINLGTGNWWNTDFAVMSQAINTVASMAASSVASTLGGMAGPLGGLLSSVEVKKTGIGVQCDVRIIKAASGEVIWNKRVVGLCDQTSVNLGGLVSFGSDKLSSELYAKAMETASTKIVDALLTDMKENKLFVK